MNKNVNSKRSRLSVAVNGIDYLQSSSHNNGTHIFIEGNSQVLGTHKRFVIEEGKKRDPEENGKSRITWSNPSLPWEKVQFWEPRMVDGFGLYSEDKLLSLNNSISTPKYLFYHSLEYEGPSHIEEVELDWEHCDIDVRYGSEETVVDQWCPLEEGEQIVYGKDIAGTRKAEYGIFNLDIDDGIDVALEGIICSWNNTGIERCQKGLTMFKKTHTLSMEEIDMRLAEPVGMHPTLEIDLSEIFPYSDKCEIFMYLTLPKNLFVDKFGGHVTDSVRPLLVSGLTDLEKPTYELQDDGWGSEILYRLRSGEINTIEFHSRYSEPRHSGPRHTSESVNFKPLLFQACDTGLSSLFQNPFYSKGTGYESYFTDDTVFHHFQNREFGVEIPAARWHDYEKTQWFTGLCLVGSVIYLSYKLFFGTRRNP